jgi:hypothetical protein
VPAVVSDRTLPENICYWSLVLTWPFYFIGALYVVGPLLAWYLFFLILLSGYLGPAIRPDLTLKNIVPYVSYVWIAGMLVMLFALWAGHINWDMGLSQTIKSSIGWAKGWAMMALFILIGSVMQIRREVIIRAQNIVGLCTLMIFPALFIAPLIGLPPKLFISPLQVIGGPGPEYFSIYLYTIDPESMTPRWQFYAPWSPFAGLIGVNIAIIASEDKSKFWKICGILAALVMIYFSKSRMSIVSVVVCLAIPRCMHLFRTQLMWVVLSVSAALVGVFGVLLAETISQSVDGFKKARASSSRVRDTIQSIGYQRWRTEAVWFGHGAVERGPHIVEYMPIGSHHTWYGLLFVKGIFGFFSLLIPMVFHMFIVLRDSIQNGRGKLPLALFLNLVILTFGENLEIEVYLMWPAIVILGIHLREIQMDSVTEK